MSTTRSVAQKMGIAAGWRAHLVDAPDAALRAMALPELDLVEGLEGEFDYIHLFVKTQEEMRERFPRLARHLGPNGKLWLSWPKARQLGSDLTLPKVIELGYSFGLVESTTLRIDDTWSAIKFTRPRPGKTYQNKYGTLLRG